MTKILHTADIQLGAQFKTLGAYAELQRAQLRKTFHKACDLAAEKKVNLMLIAGDLFDSNHPSYELVEFIRDEIKYLAENDISLAIVPGHHDSLEPDGIYNRVRFDADFPNVFIFRSPQGEVREYPDFDLAIFAKPNVSNKSTKTPLPDLRALTSSMKHKIVAAHGELKVPGKFAGDYHPIDYSEIEAMEGMDYVALGHWGSLQDCSLYGNFTMPVWYSGSPELVTIDQEGAGNVVLADFSGARTHVNAIKIGQRSSKKINVDLSLFEDSAGLKGKILESKDADLLIEVELSGLNINNIPTNPEKLEEELAEFFFHIRVLDKSHLALQEIPAYSDALLQGQFVKIMQKRIKDASDADKKMYEQALQMGLMELEGKEII